MSQPSHEALDFDALDRDGALRETAAEAVEAAGTTRASLFRRTGALAGGGLLLGAVPIALARAQGGGLPSGDVKILNYALTLEYLESTFYGQALSNGKLSGETQRFAQVVSNHENAHVAALKKTLGSQAVSKPKFDFGGTTSDQSMFQKTAMTVEDLGVAAYEGQAANIKTPAVLAAAGSILPVEARHAAWMRNIINGETGKNPSPAPEAFNPAKSMSQVLQAVKATGFIKSA